MYREQPQCTHELTEVKRANRGEAELSERSELIPSPQSPIPKTYSLNLPNATFVNMLKILSREQIREADRITIEREPIESVDLMERAAKACTDWFMQHYSAERPVIVLAGVGNNGGDALVMARRLMERGYTVSTYVVRYSEKFSEDMQVNLDRLTAAGHEIKYILEEHQFPSISSNTVVIDGLFGSGLNRKIDGLAGLCIEQINASIAEVVSIDLPSGLYSDKHTPVNGIVISASHTLTFQVPKLSFFVRENQEWIGRWSVIDIGLDPVYLATVDCPVYYVNAIDQHASFFHRDPYDHKGKFGHGLLIAGGYGTMGAATLASRAALRAGIGKLTTHVPNAGYEIMQISVPEAMCTVDDYDEFVGELPDITPYDVIGMGPGIGKNKKTRRVLKTLLQSSKVSLILDADALNLLAESKEYLKLLPKNTILTPHLGEFERMFGPAKHSFERLTMLRDAAKKYGVIIALKGAHTAIAAPNGSVYINATGNPGMATAGSGDVLTGVIAAFVAQVKDPLIATICGVYIHGLSGDIAAAEVGRQALIASDVIDHFGSAMKSTFETSA